MTTASRGSAVETLDTAYENASVSDPDCTPTLDLTKRPLNSPAAARLTVALSDFHNVFGDEVSCILVLTDESCKESCCPKIIASAVPVDGSCLGVMSVVVTILYEIMTLNDEQCTAEERMRETLVPLLELECFNTILEKLDHCVTSELLGLNFETILE